MATGSAISHSPAAFGITLLDRLREIESMDDTSLAAKADGLASELLRVGETALDAWLNARGKKACERKVEGFRLLGQHRQGARGDPSFNACRETCRELIYRTNCAKHANDSADAARQLKLAASVARHLVLFIDGKLETAGLGEFCCSSKALRAGRSETQTRPSNGSR